MKLLSKAPFTPHTLEELAASRVFPKPLPEPFYKQMLADYAAVDDVDTSQITYESDGLKITGLMAIPKIIAPRKHPILIYNRGGSREYGKLTLISAMRSMIPFARKGYLVFASNYRGNGGSEGKEEFGGADVNDVLNLLEIAAEHEGFDGKNRNMLGHSRGGMMTTQSIRRKAALNAAVSLSGMADMFASAKVPSMVKNVFEPLIPNYYSDTETVLRERSSLCWPEMLDVPLLLLHGNADEAIHHSESERLSAALTAHNKPHALHIYDKGNHALIRYWDDVLARSVAWLEAHKT